jgi:Leucine Rich repeat
LARNEKIGPFVDFCDYSLPIFPNLKALDLSECGFDANSCLSLVRAMMAPTSNVKESDASTGNLTLKLNSNNLSDSESFQEMMIQVCKLQRISGLSLSKCQLSNEGLRGMADACCKFADMTIQPILQMLDLSNNNFTETGLLDFTSRLLESEVHHCQLSQLRELNFSGNVLNEGGCIQLAALMAKGPLQSVRNLDVTGTSCGMKGATALLECNVIDGTQSCLKVLNLFGNDLGSDGFVHLSKTLQGGHPKLESLDLGGNGATEAGVVALLQAIAIYNISGQPNALQLLVVGGNQGGPTAESVVKEIKQLHPELDVARDKPGQHQRKTKQ